jgi:hypothetical protein
MILGLGKLALVGVLVTALQKKKFNRLMARAMKVYPWIKTASDLLKIDRKHFIKARGVGRTYLSILDEIIAAPHVYIPNLAARVKSTSTKIIADDEHKNGISGLFLKKYGDRKVNFGNLDKREKTATRKLWPVYKNGLTVNMVFELNHQDILKRRSSGRVTSEAIQSLQARILLDLIEFETPSQEGFVPEVLLNKVVSESEYGELAMRTLAHEIKSYVSKLDERSNQVFKFRLGMGGPAKTLEMIARELGITRERVRQIESRSLRNLRVAISFNLKSLGKWLVSLSYGELEENLTPLYELMPNQLVVGKFLSKLVEKDLRILTAGSDLGLNPKILEEIACYHSSPYNRKSLEHLIEGSTEEREFDIDAVVDIWIQDGYLQEQDLKLYPAKLGRVAAIAHVLLEYPNGLDSEGIAREVISRKLARNKSEYERRGHEMNSGLIYVSGRGIYKHTNYLTFTEEQEADLFKVIREKLSSGLGEIALYQDIYMSFGRHKNMNYFDIREIVRREAESHGFAFHGKSSTDTVTYDGSKSVLTQLEVFRRRVRDMEEPFSVEHLSRISRTSSKMFAHLKLTELMASNDVVRVAKGLYLSKEKAFKGLNYLEIFSAIRRELEREEGRLIEWRSMEGRLAERFDRIDRYLIVSLIQNYPESPTFFTAGNLFSLNPIQFKNFAEIAFPYFNRHTFEFENLNELRKQVVFSRHSIDMLAWRFRNQTEKDTNAE